MESTFSPEPASAERLAPELALLSARREILTRMTHVAQGRPSEQLLASVSRIRCPVLFLHGREDAPAPAACDKTSLARISSAVGHSTFQLLSGSGHMLIESQAAGAAKRIVGFLRS
jgi:pimeloyl-ACP methyl ester carboxylesterase